MSIPLDRLYHFIENIVGEIHRDPVIIYRFYPHGSKNIQDLNPLPTYHSNWVDQNISVRVYCYDQEPLSYDFYNKSVRTYRNDKWSELLKSLGIANAHQHFKTSPNIFQKNLLLHSEKRSQDVKKYIATGKVLPVYYWSHALIARDWFRYAEHENFKKNITKQFLIYNRAWTGTRKYRLRFSDLLIEHGLADQCLTFCNPIEEGRHYRDHSFDNVKWRPSSDLENYFQPSKVDSSASADFKTEDYRSTEIEVVLETLFDDDRLHLTEKSLRPIACRQPFILAATHGSLQYLRNYGFQTFDSVWDESYDMIEDPYNRMQAIIDVMCNISAWSDAQRLANAKIMEQIADHNQKHFFSRDFFDLVIDELRTNMSGAFDQVKSDPGFDQWTERWQYFLQFPKIQEFMDHNQNLFNPTRTQYKHILEFIDQYPKTIARNK